MAPVSPELFMYDLQGSVYADALFATDYGYVAGTGVIPGVTSRPRRQETTFSSSQRGWGRRVRHIRCQVLTRVYPVPDLSEVKVLIGGHPATVQFAGMIYTGEFQIIIQVPNGLPAGNQPIVIQMGGQESQAAAYLTVGGG